MSPPLEELRARFPLKYELVLVATRRAKQIIREQRLNPGAIAAADKMKKPLSIALQDIVHGKVDKHALMAPDIVFDQFEEEALDYFPEYEGLRPQPRELEGEVDADDSYIDEEPDSEFDEEPDDLELDEDVEIEGE
jgi:DNA-directed RNA polymerase omega subunit